MEKEKIYKDHWESYRDLGLIPLPGCKDKKASIVPYKKYEDKSPLNEAFLKWEKEFPDHNIFVLLNNFLVVEGDSEEGEKFIQSLNLPPCPTSSSGKRSVHRWFKNPSSLEKLDITVPGSNGKGEIHVEVRTGFMGMFVPPSIHPETKQPYKWMDGLSPQDIDFPEMPIEAYEKIRGLKDNEGKTTAREPRDGTTDIQKVMACDFLIHCDKDRETLSEPEWYAMISALSRVPGGADLIHDLSKGYPKYDPKETDEKIRHSIDGSWPITCDRIKELFRCGKNCGVNSPYRLIFKDAVETPSYIEELNKEYFISYFGGKVRVFKESHDPTLKRFMLEDLSVQDFGTLFFNQKVYVLNDRGKYEKTSLGHAWLEHQGRRQYLKGIRCNPTDPLCETLEMKDVFNLWKGFLVKPIKGNWQSLQDHIANILCQNDPKLVEYLLNWMARAIQKPDLQGEVGVVLIGGQGSGKGVFARSFGRLFGQHFIHISHSRHFTGHFNRHLWDCICLFVDEALYAGDRREIGNLKRMITEPTLHIEAKFKDAVIVPNMLHIIVASNEPWVIPAEEDERRFFVLNIKNDRVGDRPYFGAIMKQMETDGYAAMLHDLLNRDISGWDVWDVPNTEALQEQKIRTMEPISEWWFRRLNFGTIPQGWEIYHREIYYTNEWEKVDTKIIYEDYLESMKLQRGRYPLKHMEFILAFRNLLPPGWPRNYRPRSEGERPRYYKLPPLEDCRKFFVEKFKMKDFVWEDQ